MNDSPFSRGEPRPPDLDELFQGMEISSAKELFILFHEYFDAAIEAGFTEDQAIKLIGSLVKPG